PLKAGELGCLLSHVAVLERAAASATPTHILEDDALICRRFASFATDMVAGGVLDKCDIVFTDTMVHGRAATIGMLLKAFATIRDGGPLTFFDVAAPRGRAGSSSSLVSPGGARRVLDLLAQETKGQPALPYDIYLRNFALAGR